MSSWHDDEPQRFDLFGFLLIAVGIPLAFIGAFFALNALLLWIAGWFA